MSFLSIVVMFSYSCASNELSIGICTVVGENSVLDIREWVEYHSFIGIKNFYIFNHGPKNSSKMFSSSLAPFIRMASLNYEPFQGDGKVNLKLLEFRMTAGLRFSVGL